MQQIIVWRNGDIHADCSTEILHAALQDRQAVVWLDLQIEQDLAKYADLLTQEFKLSSLTIETIEEEKERAKLVEHKGYFYLVVHGLYFDKAQNIARTPKVDIAFGHNFLVTIHREALPWLDELLKSTRNDTSDENIMGNGQARLLHYVLDTLVDSYFPVLDDLDELIDELEITVVEKASNEVQSQLFSSKRAIVTMRRVISPQVEVSNALITRTGDFIPTEAEPYFADVHDHLVRTFEVLDSYRDLLSGLLDVHLTTVSNRLNEIMKQLAIISTIFLPITFVTGVFGQNFSHSPQVEYDNGTFFWLVLLLMAMVTLAQILYFRYRKWI